MRAFALVLLVATSAFAAPSVSVDLVGYNEIGPLPDNGGLVNRAVVDNAWGLVDAADSSVYTNTLQQILYDIADMKDKRSQLMAGYQVIAILGTLANGLPGDSCAAAAAINSYAANKSAASYIPILAQYIDILTQVAGNPLARRYASGPVGGCVGGGRQYQFEAAWDRILASASPNAAGLVNEEYCAVKRLYNANSVVSNNVAAAATAAAAVATERGNPEPLLRFLRVLAYNGGNMASAAAGAKSALVY